MDGLIESVFCVQYLYLHGFASGPQSAKAQYLADRFRERGLHLTIPDLNQNDFTHLTLTRQIQQVKTILQPDIPVTLLGSSFGGLTAAWLGQSCAQVERLILLAPAFQFLQQWLPRLGAAQMQQWQAQGYLSVYHYSAKQPLPLDYGFLTDLQRYSESQIQRPVPTLILHGIQDEVIPITASREFAANRVWVELIELDSDHALTDNLPKIWQMIHPFLER